MNPILLYKTNPDAIIPTYATDRSACFDVHACLRSIKSMKCKAYNPGNFIDDLLILEHQNIKFISIPPRYRVLIPTGFIFGLPATHSFRLHVRSGMALKYGIMLANSEGIIDSHYPEETFVMLTNLSDVDFVVKHGDRIAQGELVKDHRWEFQLSETNPVLKSDRKSGLGSTGQ